MTIETIREIPKDWWEEPSGQASVLDYDKVAKLVMAVRAYISECDNPVPDASYRRVLRNQLRQLVEAPAEPPPRRL